MLSLILTYKISMSIEMITNFSISEDLSPGSIYIILFLSLIANGTLNFPSSQIIYLTLGYVITKNPMVSPIISVLVGATANTIGNLILYKLINKNNDFLNSKLAKFMGVDEKKLDYYMDQLKNKGVWWLVIGKSVPTLKVLVPILVGLSNIKIKKATAIFFFGSLIWAIIVTYLGYHFGKTANLIQFYVIVTFIYIIIGIATSYKINKKTGGDIL